MLEDVEFNVLNYPSEFVPELESLYMLGGSFQIGNEVNSGRIAPFLKKKLSAQFSFSMNYYVIIIKNISVNILVYLRYTLKLKL